MTAKTIFRTRKTSMTYNFSRSFNLLWTWDARFALYLKRSIKTWNKCIP